VATVTIRECKIDEKSLEQDFVFVDGKLAGYLTWPRQEFKPLVGWNNAFNQMVCDALQILKGEEFGPITFIDAPEMPVVEEENEDDE
jgi:hypothetical protein